MARSRSLAVCLLITCIFFLLLICLDNTNAAMGYDLLLVAVVFYNISSLITFQSIIIFPVLSIILSKVETLK